MNDYASVEMPSLIPSQGGWVVWKLLLTVFWFRQEVKVRTSGSEEKATKAVEEEKPLKMKINSWFGVSTWRWVADDSVCGICRNTFESCCGTCRLPGDGCPLAVGRCSHHFHLHCIMNWLGTRSSGNCCPLCRQSWRFREADDKDSHPPSPS